MRGKDVEMSNHTSVDYPMTKIATVLAAAGVATWADAAALLAALYTGILIGEWLWRRAIRPFCERRGWLERQMRRRDDSSD